ncbi:hypothetical protein M422DRAFT_159022 [Sphaerobolus stellatus SS14]|nr:hypothetical protein M422DRAFT_159022 [Sphaerobolus stellatus SS14]
MAFTKIALLSLVSIVTFQGVTSSPLRILPRIAQTIADSTHDWEQACDKAGGSTQCNPQSQASFMTLLAAAGDCDQQDEADNMIDLAKKLNNDAEMIRLTQLFVQQPRNSPNSVAIPYCQKQARNTEIQGLFQCQFQGSNQAKFSNGQSVGGNGTIPLGLSAPLSPAGSCKAHPAGPIADGAQLESLVSDPGVSSTSATASAASATATTDDGDVPADSGDTSFPDSTSSSCPGEDTTSTATAVPSATVSDAATTATPAASATSTASSGDFQQQNGKDAQTQNAAFAQLTADSTCNEGDQACVNGGFAQCVGGKFEIQACAGGTQCFALPLVNKAGTSLACTTEADASSRIATSGATGGITGSNA